MNTRLSCQKCLYYYVTWQANKPHGCKAFGFKSRQIPSMIVYQNSGAPCGLYEQKHTIKNKD
jgi:hypothetical protein